MEIRWNWNGNRMEVARVYSASSLVRPHFYSKSRAHTIGPLKFIYSLVSTIISACIGGHGVKLI